MKHIRIKLWDTKSGCQIKRWGRFISQAKILFSLVCISCESEHLNPFFLNKVWSERPEDSKENMLAENLGKKITETKRACEWHKDVAKTNQGILFKDV